MSFTTTMQRDADRRRRLIERDLLMNRAIETANGTQPDFVARIDAAQREISAEEEAAMNEINGTPDSPEQYDADV